MRVTENSHSPFVTVSYTKKNRSAIKIGRPVLIFVVLMYPSNLPRPDIKTNLLCRAKEISHLSVSHGINMVPGVLENSFVRYISVSSPAQSRILCKRKTAHNRKHRLIMMRPADAMSVLSALHISSKCGMICYTDRAVDKQPKIWYNRNNQTRRGKSNEIQQRIQRKNVKAFR